MIRGLVAAALLLALGVALCLPLGSRSRRPRVRTLAVLSTATFTAGKFPGTSIITASSGGKSGTATVHVVAPSPAMALRSTPRTGWGGDPATH